MTTLRDAAQQALEALCLWATGRDMDAVALNDLILRLEAALAEPVLNPAPGYCKHCKQYTIEEPLPAEPTVPSDCTDSHQPVGWFEGPFGEFRANPLHRIAWPAQTVAWSIPLYITPPQPQRKVQEPVAWGCFKDGELQSELIGTKADADFWVASDEPHMQGMVAGPLYAAPPQRKPLTEEEIADAANSVRWSQQYHVDFASAIERAHGIGEQK